jgi:glucose/arabinose dehydrogenase
MRPTISWLGAVLALTMNLGPADAHPDARGQTIHSIRVLHGLKQPVAFTFTPNGRIFYLEKTTGEIHLADPANDANHRFFTVSHVNGSGERGMLGVALHPHYPSKPFVYVYATRSVHGHLRNQILRIRSSGGHGTGMKVIFSAPASASPYHNGGRIMFGLDGDLYAFVGDAHDSSNAQDTSRNDRGKMLRMTPTGRRPATNPFRNLIWSYGNRNSFGFDFDPQTNDLWETENGPECNDELNLITKGDNFGWGPHETCSGSAPDNTNQDGPNVHLPRYWYTNTLGITGMAFCQACNLNPASEGTFFFGDVNNGKLYRADLNPARDDLSGDPSVILTHSGSILSLETAPNGTIYFSDFGAIYKLVFS